MCWVFINLICVGDLFPVIELQILSTEYVLDIYQVDTTLISIKLICVGYLFPRICVGDLFPVRRLQILSTEYVLENYQS